MYSLNLIFILILLKLKNQDKILSLSIETEVKNQFSINEVSRKLKPFSGKSHLDFTQKMCLI